MRTIQSPGVEIREIDISQVGFQPTGTNVFLAGFSQRGPTDEVIQITSLQDLEQIYGAPVTPAERYFYHTAKQIVTDSNATLFVNRIPYGPGSGYGYGSSFGALVYPVVTLEKGNTDVWRASKSVPASAFRFGSNSISSLTGGGLSAADIISLSTNGIAFDSTDYAKFTLEEYQTLIDRLSVYGTAAVSAATDLKSSFFSAADVYQTNTLNITAGTYVLGAPKFFELTLEQYNAVVEGTAFTWATSSADIASISSVADFGKAGLILLNRGQTVTEAQAEGFYAAITDNTNAEPTTDHDSIIKAYTVTRSAPDTGLYGDAFTQIPEERLNFALSGGNDVGINRDDSNISYNLERTFFNFTDSTSEKFDDTLSISLYKLRRSIYTPDAIKMDYVLERNFIGSLDYNRKIQDTNGGSAVSYFISSPQKESRAVKILVNDNITNRGGDTWLNAQGIPSKKVRLYTNSALKSLTDKNEENGNRFGGYFLDYKALSTKLKTVDALYPTGPYTNLNITTKEIGNLPTKIENALYKVENDELFDLDLVVEGGLGTIFTTCCANKLPYFDDTVVSANFAAGLDLLKSTGEYNSPADVTQDLRALYNTIFSKFDTFCSQARKDCMFIADPLRQIFVKGENSKVLPNASNSFSRDIYSSLKHLFELANSNYSCTYGNWAKIYDAVAGLNVWVPFSGFAASSFVNTDSNFYPWYAPAGFTRGKVRNVLELAVAPKQKERDQLYKIAINPVAFFPGDGITIYGQKTMQRQPSTFDRINVRRMFLYLEKATKKTVKYFVFEPNSTFTRTRLVNALNPIFNFAKSTDGLADYMIVSDRRNNTPESIDNNELVVDIYIKPVRASEFILVNFIATRTGADFNELVGGPRV
jgi:hypothetical protein